MVIVVNIHNTLICSMNNMYTYTEFWSALICSISRPLVNFKTSHAADDALHTDAVRHNNQ